MIKITFLMFTLLNIASCVGTMSGAYETFAEDLGGLIGKSFESSYVYNIGYLSQLKPDEIKPLANGNEIRVYAINPPRIQKCKVHIEVDSNSIVVGATSEGPECWRAY